MRTNQLTTTKYYPADAVLTGPDLDTLWISFKVDADTQRILDCKWVAITSDSVLDNLVAFSDRVIGQLLQNAIQEGEQLFQVNSKTST